MLHRAGLGLGGCGCPTPKRPRRCAVCLPCRWYCPGVVLAAAVGSLAWNKLEEKGADVFAPVIASIPSLTSLRCARALAVDGTCCVYCHGLLAVCGAWGEVDNAATTRAWSFRRVVTLHHYRTFLVPMVCSLDFTYVGLVGLHYLAPSLRTRTALTTLRCGRTGEPVV